MAVCRWLEPFIVARIEFLEWTPDNRLRRSRLADIRSDKDAREVREVVREEPDLLGALSQDSRAAPTAKRQSAPSRP
jgi:ATP-dependent DNA ligase